MVLNGGSLRSVQGSSPSSSDSMSSESFQMPKETVSVLTEGYNVLSAGLDQIAQCLETGISEDFPVADSKSGEIMEMPDLSFWVNSLLGELNETLPAPPLLMPADLGEDYEIRLVHALITCAKSIQCGNLTEAGSLIDDMHGRILSHVNISRGIGKVAAFFIQALLHRVFSSSASFVPMAAGDVLYHHFYEASPCLKFSHFTANQAILEAFAGQERLHVVDFSFMQGLQWPALIQALALRPGGPPHVLRLTGIGSPSDHDELGETGVKLGQLAGSLNLKFIFHGVVASRLEDVKPWMLHVDPKETLAVNSVLQLHKLLGSSSRSNSPIGSVLFWIRSLGPKIVTVVEQEAHHNVENFLDRFTEGLYYYSTMFDSLEACNAPISVRAMAETYIQREIMNVIGCEGEARVERHEPISSWKERMESAGFKPVHLGYNAFKQANMLLNLFFAEGFCVEEKEGFLTLGWHKRPLISASAWRPDSNLG